MLPAVDGRVFGIGGGNSRLPKALLNSSLAAVHVGVEVKSIAWHEGKFTLSVVNASAASPADAQVQPRVGFVHDIEQPGPIFFVSFPTYSLSPFIMLTGRFRQVQLPNRKDMCPLRAIEIENQDVLIKSPLRPPLRLPACMSAWTMPGHAPQCQQRDFDALVS